MKSVTPARSTPTPVPPKSRGSSDKHAAAHPSQPPASIAPELADRWREIVGRAATIDRADYFMMLDIARDATLDQIEEAFFGLAKIWHPDRLPPELAPVRAQCSRVFARMGEAHAALTDAEKRKRYMKLLADGSGTPEAQEQVARVVEAAQTFQKAEVCFKRNDMVQAEALVLRAAQADPTQAEYLALLAWLTSLKPENQARDKTVECIKLLDKAVELNERCEKAIFWRGMLHKRVGHLNTALRDFRAVVELNPRHIDAAREVRLHEMRSTGKSNKPAMSRPTPTPTPPRNSDSGDKSGGLFGKLFKK
jgi:curved DNA-binding protein CbpA